MSAPMFTSDSRLMLIAPHPDDEALACGIILQRAVRADAPIRVVYATDGDDNPWPQRVLERKWRLNAADRKRWGKLRRAEALGALRILGVSASSVRFLALPDQGLTDLLKCDCRSALERFRTVIRNWSPTHLLVPSIADTHPDHSALAVMLRLVLAEFFSDRPQMSVWSYAVHGRSAAFFDGAQKLRQSRLEMAAKQRAIHSHKTQLKLSRWRFLAYATRPEHFRKLVSAESSVADGPIRSISRQEHKLHVTLRLSAKPAKPIRSKQPKLFVLGHDPTGALRCVDMQIPDRSSCVEMADCFTEQRLGLARYRGTAFTGEFTVPIDILSSAHALFVKLERRLWFFDEAGWLEIPRTARLEQIPAGERSFVEQPSLPIR